jgi:hypothetical protein
MKCPGEQFYFRGLFEKSLRRRTLATGQKRFMDERKKLYEEVNWKEREVSFEKMCNECYLRL